MERSVAIKKLSKMLGKSLGYRVDPKGLVSEEREAAIAKAKELNEAFKLAEAAEAARRQAILDADAEYQRLSAWTKSLRDAKAEARSKSNHFKVTVGHTTTFGFFHIDAQGDSWEDVIGQLERKREKTAA